MNRNSVSYKSGLEGSEILAMPHSNLLLICISKNYYIKEDFCRVCFFEWLHYSIFYGVIY